MLNTAIYADSVINQLLSQGLTFDKNLQCGILWRSISGMVRDDGGQVLQIKNHTNDALGSKSEPTYLTTKMKNHKS